VPAVRVRERRTEAGQTVGMRHGTIMAPGMARSRGLLPRIRT
jgi:hypothetical protein